MKKSVLFFGCLALGILPLTYGASADKSAEDQHFVNEAALGGKMEIELGTFAERMVRTPRLNSLASKW